MTVIDSRFLVPMDLDLASDIVGKPPIGGPGLPCSCERPCGGYCSIEGWSAQVEALCVADAVRLYEVIARLSEHALEHELELRGTLGGTAWATAKARLGLPDAEWRTSTWTRVRRASYGGRVTVARPRAAWGVQYDLASAYPAALARTPVPVGVMEEVGRRQAMRGFDARRAGVYRATVRVPDERWLPPLPWRHAGRIGYPTGQVTGTWTELELAAACERGVTIERIHSAVLWSRSEVLYDSMLGEWLAVRQRVGKRSGLGEWQRLLCNAFTGKLDEGPDREMLVCRPSEVRHCDPDAERSRRAGCTVRRCTGRCGAMRQADRWGRWWSVPYFRMAESAHAHHAAYLKSAARVQWLEGAESIGEALCYGDTDSLWIAPTGDSEAARPAGAIGEEAGEWTYKGAFAELEVRAPKSYRFVNEAGEVVCRAAGTRVTDRQWRELAARPGHELEDKRGVMSLRESLLAGGPLFRRRTQPVRLPRSEGWYGDRLHGPDGFTYPVDRGTLEERWSRSRSHRPT